VDCRSFAYRRTAASNRRAGYQNQATLTYALCICGKEPEISAGPTTAAIAHPQSGRSAPATFGDCTKRTILRSEALLAFAVLMTERKMVRVSTPVAEKISDTVVCISGSA
jgi:hypothetical protein